MSRGAKTTTAIDNKTTTPSNEAYLNLSDYMYYAYNTPYSSTSLQSEIGFKPLTVNGKIVQSVVDADGFYGEAFVSVSANGQETKNSQIVVAYEGTNLLYQSNTFTGGQIQDDADIIAGTNAPSYKDAAAFARKVVGDAKNLNISKSNVFLTGHSLGGANAEYAAKVTGLGGATFAAPGIKDSAASPTNLTDYIDAGDPLGNYSQNADKDPASAFAWGNAITLSDKINHYGTLDEIKNASNFPAQSALTFYGNIFKAALHPPPPAPPQVGGAEAALAAGLVSGLASTDTSVTVGGFTISGLGFFHGFDQYAHDLNVNLYLPDPTCFAAGTRIRVVRNDDVRGVAVEDLVVGDHALTASGALRRILWLGHRAVSCAREPARVGPVRIAAHAFGASIPERDLFLSPGHPVLVGADEDGAHGHLVPIMCLINGTTIERVIVEEVTYWHVELEQHDILLAEGLPAESYIDLGSRPWFAGAEGVLYDPDLTLPGQPGRCRPVAIDGPVVETERRRLDVVFATRLAAACDWGGEQDALFAD